MREEKITCDRCDAVCQAEESVEGWTRLQRRRFAGARWGKWEEDDLCPACDQLVQNLLDETPGDGDDSQPDPQPLET